MSSGAPKATTQTSSTEPPKYVQPFLKDAAQEARGLYMSGGPDYYQGTQTVGFSPQSQTAMGMTEQRALAGNPANRAATNMATDTLNGNYLYGNPGFNAAVKSATDYTIPQVQSRFATAGRTNSGLAQEAVARTISNQFANQYGQERENQMRAGVMAPALAQQDYQDISALRGVGTDVEQLAQDRLSEDVSRFNFYQQRPEQNLQNYIQNITGSYPGQSSSASSPLYRNRSAGALGGAMSGAQLGGQYGGGWGALFGALGGGLLGGQ